jgi:hypothetical protein
MHAYGNHFVSPGVTRLPSGVGGVLLARIMNKRGENQAARMQASVVQEKLVNL